MHVIASRWLIYDVSHNALLVGLDAFASGLPAALLLRWGGVLADRLDRRKILIVGNTLFAINVGLLAAAWYAEVLQVWHILVVSMVNGLITERIRRFVWIV